MNYLIEEENLRLELEKDLSRELLSCFVHRRNIELVKTFS